MRSLSVVYHKKASVTLFGVKLRGIVRYSIVPKVCVLLVKAPGVRGASPDPCRCHPRPIPGPRCFQLAMENLKLSCSCRSRNVVVVIGGCRLCRCCARGLCPSHCRCQDVGAVGVFAAFVAILVIIVVGTGSLSLSHVAVVVVVVTVSVVIVKELEGPGQGSRDREQGRHAQLCSESHPNCAGRCIRPARLGRSVEQRTVRLGLDLHFHSSISPWYDTRR